MKTFRLFTRLALFALAFAVLGCSKAEEREAAPAEDEASETAAAEAGEGEAEETTPSEPKSDAVARPPVQEGGEGARAAKSGEAGAKKGAPEGDEAARLAGPRKDERELVAIGASKTKIVRLANKTLAETDEYLLRLELPDEVKKGSEGTVKVKLSPKKGWKLNKEFPTKLEVQPPSGVKVAKKSQGVEDAVSFSEKKGAVWEVDFEPSSSGEKEFGGSFKFAVCTETTCDPKKEKLAFAVEVK